MAQVGLHAMSVHTPVAKLALAEKQLVEMAKALSMPADNCQLLILDEPASALTTPQVEKLHQIFRSASRLA